MGKVVDMRMWCASQPVCFSQFALVDDQGREIPVSQDRLEQSLLLAEELECLNQAGLAASLANPARSSSLRVV